VRCVSVYGRRCHGGCITDHPQLTSGPLLPLPLNGATKQAVFAIGTLAHYQMIARDFAGARETLLWAQSGLDPSSSAYGEVTLRLAAAHIELCELEEAEKLVAWAEREADRVDLNKGGGPSALSVALRAIQDGIEVRVCVCLDLRSIARWQDPPDRTCS
jgi:hypothetical protein